LGDGTVKPQNATKLGVMRRMTTGARISEPVPKSFVFVFIARSVKHGTTLH
tara:strand:- start:1709 stop:1861 length:153 start_codon:yes stop_codon:yes gene_type:complete